MFVPSIGAARMLEAAGVPLAPSKLAGDTAEAVAAARSPGYPVAVKTESCAIAHESDGGGVKLALGDDDAVRSAFGSVVHSVHVIRAHYCSTLPAVARTPAPAD